MASLGQTLKEDREARNISIEEIASATKIVPRYLEALEADHLDIMPGGFFVKGIIRTYARSIGLDPDEVLARYKAAGLLGEPERKRHVFQKPTPEPSPVAPPVPPAMSLPAVEPALAAEPEPASELVIEEAPAPRLSPAARKRIIALAWRGAAAVLVGAVLIVLWSSRRPRPPQVKPGAIITAPEPVVTRSEAVQLPAQKTQQESAPASQPQTQPSSQPPPTAAAPATEPPPAVEKEWKGVTIEISFQAETWIQIYTDGELKVDGLFPAGATARAQANERLLIHVGNAGGFTFLLNGKPAKPLGRSGQVLTDIKITPENYKDFLAGQSPGPPTG
jgi:cytoskeleton protein RodZ